MSEIPQLDISKLPDTPFVRQAKQKATELEGVFLNTLVKQMMSGLGDKDGMGGSDAEKTWRSMQSEYLADAIAKNGGIGLSNDILRGLLQQQEATTSPSVPSIAPSTYPASAEIPS